MLTLAEPTIRRGRGELIMFPYENDGVPNNRNSIRY